MKKITKISAVCLALVLGFSVLTGCGNGANGSGSGAEGSQQQAPRETTGGSGRTDMNVRVSDAITTFDPHYSAITSEQHLEAQTYEALYFIADDGSEVPKLASSYEVSDDGLTWTFHLREGVTFHNGDPVKASDVVYSYNRAIQSPYYASIVEPIDSITADGSDAFVVQLKYQFAPFINYVAQLYIISESFADANKNSEGSLGFAECGTGPYALKDYQDNVSVTLEAYEGYWGEKAPIQTVRVEIIVDSSTALIAFEAGELDVLTVPSANWKEISDSGSYSTYEQATNHITYLMMNNRVEPYNNKLVRQAISYAINKEDCISIAADGFARKADSMSNDYIFGHTADTPVYEYNLEKARALLAEAGYPDGFDAGVMKTLTGGHFEKTMQVIQQNLAAIGITGSLEAMEAGAYVEDCLSGNYGLAIMGETLKTDYAFLDQFFDSSYISGGYNMAGYSNPEVDALFKAGVETLNKDQRLEVYKKLQNILQEDAVYVPVFNINKAYAWNKDLDFKVGMTINYYSESSWK